MWKIKIKRILSWTWEGIQVWNMAISFGMPAIVRGFFGGVFESWPLYRQLLLFGGSVFVILGLLAVLVQRSMLASKTSRDKAFDMKQPTRSWLDEVVQNDEDNIAKRIHRTNYIWSFRGLKNDDSFMEVTVTLINATTFPILVGGVKGRFLVKEQECAQFAEMEGRTRIPHGELGNIRIKQHISQEMMNSILSNIMRKEPLNINLKSCELEIQSEIPGKLSKPINIILGQDCYVEIPDITAI